MSFLSSLFGGGSAPAQPTITSQPQAPGWQLKTGKALSEWARKYLNLYQPGQAYSGQLSVTQPTGLEQAGLGELGNLLGDQGIYGAAKGQLADTLAGKFANPAESPFIKAYTQLAGQNLQDAITTARGQRGARGTYFTKAGIQEESRLSERTQNQLNALIGDFMERERGRQFAAAPLAQEYGLRNIGASQQYGGLQRLLEQSDLERKYNEWLNQRGELQGVPQAAGAAFGTHIPYQTTATLPQQQPSAFQQIAPWISLAAKVLPAFI